MHLPHSCFTEQYKLDAAARLRLRGCVRHCDAVDVEAQDLRSLVLGAVGDSGCRLSLKRGTMVV
jgi:hypothetical protein